MVKDKPFFSIITVTYNDGDVIERTLKSLVRQSSKDYEYIVVYSKSPDDTKRKLAKYRQHINIFKQTKPEGVYTAMNQALAKAGGEYVYFLNGGDELHGPSTLSRAKRELTKAKLPDLAYGDIDIIDENGKQELKRVEAVTNRFLIEDTICHQALFVKASLFDTYGKFNKKYKVCADYEWLLKVVFKSKKRPIRLPVLVAKFYLGGLSSTVNGMSERARARRKWMPSHIRLRFFWLPLYNFIKRVRRRLSR